MYIVILVALAMKIATAVIGYVYGRSTLQSSALAARRLQGDQSLPSEGEFARRSLRLLTNVLILCALFPLAGFAADFVTLEVPSLGVFTLQLLTLILVEDLYVYWVHAAMHRSQFLYDKVHSVHHSVSAPLASDYLYVHPVEAISVALGFAVGCTAVILSFGVLYAWPFWAWAVLRMSNAVLTHSGIHARFWSWLPFLAATDHHDLHHETGGADGNFGAMTLIWDKLFGTMIPDSRAES